MYNLVRLGRMLANPKYEEYASLIGMRFSESIEGSYGGFSMMLSALDFSIGPTVEVVIAGEEKAEDTINMLRNLHEIYAPNMTVLLRGSQDQKEMLNDLAEYTRYHDAIGGKATAHVCVNQNCRLPTTDLQTMIDQIHH